ncbi:MAG: hypothetical protein IJ795_02035 [Bacteroidales bacterium]|nr:hypothetical protein [Bacteroidales bacterium]
MEYGQPFLTPAAKEELDRIAGDFHECCKARELPSARLIITSLLRTEDDVGALQKSNSNAVSHSAHMYGTTMDISWSFYQCPIKNADGNAFQSILADILRQYRKEGTLLVRYETSQRCFHITVNR